MDTDKKLLRRRAMLTSMLGLGLGAVGWPAFATVPEFPQLVEPAIPALDPSRHLMIASGKAGNRLFAGGMEGLIIYSDDAGQSWRQAQVPVSTTITAIAFADAKTGWATGGFGVVLGTTDGGLTWVKQLDGLQEIAMMNTVTAAFIATLPPGSDTADHLTRRADILTKEGPDKPFLCLLPLSATNVFACGTYRSVEFSSNGGKDWTDWSMKIGDPAAISRNIYGAALIGGDIYLASEVGIIYRSTDGGASFQQLIAPGLAQPGQATFFGICDTGAGGILAYGVAGEIMLSLDGGKSWNPSNFTGSANVNAVVVLPGGEIVAGDAGGALWLSHDGGRNFTFIMRNPLMSINALQPVAGTQFLIMSDIGVTPFDLAALHA